MRSAALGQFSLAAARDFAGGFPAGIGAQAAESGLLATFPVFITVLSLIMWRLDVRKDRRKAADKARRARADQRGGW